MALTSMTQPLFSRTMCLQLCILEYFTKAVLRQMGWPQRRQQESAFLELPWGVSIVSCAVGWCALCHVDFLAVHPLVCSPLTVGVMPL